MASNLSEPTNCSLYGMDSEFEPIATLQFDDVMTLSTSLVLPKALRYDVSLGRDSGGHESMAYPGTIAQIPVLEAAWKVGLCSWAFILALIYCY